MRLIRVAIQNTFHEAGVRRDAEAVLESKRRESRGVLYQLKARVE